MRRAFALALAILGALLILAAETPAEERRGALRLDLTFRGPVIVLPTPTLEVVVKDAAEALAEAKTRQPSEAVLKEARPDIPRRPDLDYDVKSGLQSRGLRDALRPR